MRIREIDALVGRTLQEKGQITFPVAMAFQTTLCGYHEGVFLTVLEGGKKLLPYSLVLEEPLAGHSFRQGDLVTLSAQGDGDFLLGKDTKQTDLTMPSLGDRTLAGERMGILKTALEAFGEDTPGMIPVLRAMGKLSGEPEENPMVTTVASRVLGILEALAKNQDITEKNILGYGMGLTPSADDFLTGLCAVLDRFGERDRKYRLKRYIEQYLGTTTAVSAEMLRACCGPRRYPQIVRECLREKPENFRLEDFLAHGSTSGKDLLCGLYCGLELVKKG